MKRLTAGILGFMLFVSVLLCGRVPAEAAGYHEYNIEEYVLRELSAAHIPGMNMSIVSDEKEVYSATFGSNTSTDEDYVLDSLTHSMTALGIMRLVEDGELSLKDPLSVYLPQYKALADVTVEQLLQQTSGIPMEAMMDDLELRRPSGKYEAAYANYNLLGEVIEKVSGETYEEYITENILDSCEMSSTYSFRQNPELRKQAASVYQTYFGYPSCKQYEYHSDDPWIQVSGGYMFSDVKDMGKYLQMYLKNDDEIMQSDSIARVLEGNSPIEAGTMKNHLFGTEEEYGMGWISTNVEGVNLYYQIGFLENTMSFMLLVPERNAGIIMMFNEADYMVGKDMIRSICRGVTHILLDGEPNYIAADNYLKYHGVVDLLLLLAVLAAGMPIFLTGVWYRKAGKKFSVLRLLKDIGVNLILPSAILLFVPRWVLPWTILQRYVPDVVLVLWVVAGILYFGALLKLIQSIVLIIRHKLHKDGEGDKEEILEETAEHTETEESKETVENAEAEQPEETVDPEDSEQE